MIIKNVNPFSKKNDMLEITMQNKFQIRLLVLIYFFLSSIVIYFGFRGMTVTSDFAYYSQAGQDIFNGNVFLKNWYGSTNNFYLLCFIYGFAGLLRGGYNPGLIYLVSAIILSLFYCIIVYIVYCFSNEKLQNNIVNWKVICTILLLLLSNYSTWNMTLCAGAHIDCAIIGLLYCFTFNEYIYKETVNRITITLLMILYVISVIAAFSDALYIYFSVIPFCLALIINLVKKRSTKKESQKKVFCLLATISIVVFSHLLKYIFLLERGIYTPWNSTSISFVNITTELPQRICFFIECVCALFDGDPSGVPVNGNAIFVMARCILAIVLLVLAIYVIIKRPSDNIFVNTLKTTFLLFAFIAIFTNYIQFSDTASYTTRLMYYFYYSEILLITTSNIKFQTIIDKIRNRDYLFVPLTSIRPSVIKTIFIVASLALFSISYVSSNLNKKDNNVTASKIAKTLKDNNLTYGYASFWLSNVSSLYSGNQIHVLPIAGAVPERFEWLSKTDPNCKYANFVVIDDSGWGDITYDSIIDSIGQTANEIDVDNAKILIWNYNIMPYIKNSGCDGETLVGWWSIPEGEDSKEIDVNNKHFKSVFFADQYGKFKSNSMGQLIYGPFEPLEAGMYTITFMYSYPQKDPSLILGYVDVCANHGENVFSKKEFKASEDSVSVEITLDEDVNDLETRMYAYVSDITIDKVIIERK